MAIYYLDKNGVTQEHYNYYLIPLFLLIPKELLDHADTAIKTLPRSKRALLRSDIVKSDLFTSTVIDAYSRMLLPFICPGQRPEAFSDYALETLVSYFFNLWYEGLVDTGAAISVRDYFQYADWSKPMGYVPMDKMLADLSVSVPYTLQKYSFLSEYLKVGKENRCFEDFTSISSTAKKDFYRHWYHTRSKHKTVSLEEYKEKRLHDFETSNKDIEDYSANFEDDLIAKDLVQRFMKTLSEKDRQILHLRMEGVSLESIAKELGYTNHSGVIKRIRRIGQAYEKYAGVDYGFSEKKIL